MKINYHFQNTNPCSPQRYLANLEAMFEAYPQFLIHLYFLVSLDETAKSSVINDVVIVSLLFSLFTIVSKKWSQDQQLVETQWQNVDLQLNCQCLLCFLDPEAPPVQSIYIMENIEHKMQKR